MTVSILMLTYNHEKFIAQAIESVLMQKVSFNYELIIGDDCSQDNTQKIIREYQKKHPDIIKPVLRTKNIGANNNFVDIFKKATGKYIALLEGDDYWTDPNKLQKQVDFLEANPEYGIVST
ncbi:MAG: glycosyltransferase, partial [Bacteroidales bacterium]|nr:glycosyltransferase [Bacteroidales bacterium]